jgi:cephalosporin-C deacetylase-like acetyl esterase
LKRQVALKFLPPAIAHDEMTRARFQREAESASALDHPNIATIYEIAEWEGQPFIAMAYYQGMTLRQRLEGRIPLSEILSVASQTASGLAAAHAAGIVHRDIKPANIAVTQSGQVKILDFGLARLAFTSSVAPTRLTEAHTVVGTLSYMAPEVIAGVEADFRSDVWSLGVVLYEMLAGHPPFSADQPGALMAAIVDKEPAKLSDLRPDTPPEVRQLVAGALEKDPSRRTISAARVAERLRAQEFSGVLETQTRPRPNTRKTVLAASVAIVLLAMAGFAVRQTMNVRWARAAVSQAQQLADEGKFFDAFRLALQAAPYLTDPTEAETLWSGTSRLATVRTDPPGAVVHIREYGTPKTNEIELGLTPLEHIRVPRGVYQWRIEKEPLVPAEDVGPSTSQGEPTLDYTLGAKGSGPPGMVHVSATSRPFVPFIAGLSDLPPLQLPEYWIDKFEVTNAQFKTFVDAGGYQRQEFWKEEFVKDGRKLSWSEAVALFRDTTGRPGPATWSEGRFAHGEEQKPVAGVSWYEAAAYAVFAERSLPTLYHWSLAAEQRLGGPVILASNFDSQGTKVVGASGAMSRFGTFDMMGNVREWLSNAAQSNQRYILGGAWDDPYYQAFAPDARSPFERGLGFGFRTVKHSTGPAPDAALARFDYPHRDFKSEKAAGDDLFKVYRGLFAYDREEPQARVEPLDSKSPDWTREKVTFEAAYGNETLIAHVFLPTHVRPPYQAIVFFPGADVIQISSGDRDMPSIAFDFIVRSGRAVVFPVYKSTFERRDEITSGFPNPSHYYRDHVTYWMKDVGRTIDYLETRPDIDKDRIGYYGVSWGALLGPIVNAVEPRLKAAVWVSGGFTLQKPLTEVDQIHFAPRVRVPVLMLNGLYDFYFPAGISQQPMYDAIGTAEPLKRWRKFESGHNVPRNELIKETLGWFDSHFGEVRRP